ncbi:hypothetical protein K2Q16_01570 [Patescibacteria group bacterium]|nr:hypothetical protein [Patescibacteria group bacterium]
MDNMLLIATVIQGVAISLGVGTSTMAIVNFFGAIADGKIDEAERRMMGFTYFVLRIAMVVILLTVLASFTAEVMMTGTLVLGTATVATIVLVSMLYINAILMTTHIMPSTFGPALQATSWYTLGIMASLSSLGLVTFGILPFLLGYVTFFLLGVALVNGIMAVLKSRRESPPPAPPKT